MIGDHGGIIVGGMVLRIGPTGSIVIGDYETGLRGSLAFAFFVFGGTGRGGGGRKVIFGKIGGE